MGRGTGYALGHSYRIKCLSSIWVQNLKVNSFYREEGDSVRGSLVDPESFCRMMLWGRGLPGPPDSIGFFFSVTPRTSTFLESCRVQLQILLITLCVLNPKGPGRISSLNPGSRPGLFVGFLALGIALYYLVTRKQILNVLRGSLLAILAIPSSPRLAVWYFCLHQMKAATLLGILTSTTTPCLIHCSMSKATYKRSHLIELGAC